MAARTNQLGLLAGLIAGIWAAAPVRGQLALEDVVVLIDSSGSLGASGFTNEKNFLVELNHALPSRSQNRLGIIQFASTVATRYNLTQAQILSQMDNIILNLAYTGGDTHTNDAVQQAINLFDAQSPATNTRALILLTDGPPFPATQDASGLVSALSSRGIPLLVVGHGDGFHSNDFSYATNTGGHVYMYSPLSSASADQFVSDAAQYFGLVGLLGDFNHNNVVDAADYATWRKGLGTSYTQTQYDLWRTHFGQTPGSGSSSALRTDAVPEPSLLGMFPLAICACLTTRRQPFIARFLHDSTHLAPLG